MTSCGMRIDTSGDQDVNVSDSEQTITVQTTLDRILKICGIILEDGSVVPYSDWTAEQHECLDKLDTQSKGLENERGD